jgi:hypothetical protein
MKAVHRIAVTAFLAATSLAASAAASPKPGELIVPVCGTADSVVVTVSSKDAIKVANDALEALFKAGKPMCATPGPIAGAWVLDGSLKAMNVGIIPAGLDSAPHLLVQSPRYQLVGPLTVEVVKGAHQVGTGPGEMALVAGVGGFRGQGALSIGIVRSNYAGQTFSAKVSTSSVGTAFAAGGSWKF